MERRDRRGGQTAVPRAVLGASLPGVGHPSPGPRAVYQELAALHSRPGLRRFAARRDRRRRSAARSEFLGAAQRVANPYRISAEHGRPCFDVHLAAPRGPLVGPDCLSPLRRRALRAVRCPDGLRTSGAVPVNALALGRRAGTPSGTAPRPRKFAFRSCETSKRRRTSPGQSSSRSRTFCKWWPPTAPRSSWETR